MSEPIRDFAPATRANRRDTYMVRALAIFAIVGLFLLLAVTATAATFNPADYDANGDCVIDKVELVAAINDYLFGDLEKNVLVDVINLYLFGDTVCEPEPPNLPISGDGTPLSLSEMVAQVRPSVVMIVSLVHPSYTYGSGVIFEIDGQSAYVLTNQHVVDWSQTVQVVVNDEDTYYGTVLGRDQYRDLAVVKICCGTFQAAEFGDASELRVGDDVVAMGYAWDGLMPRTVDPWYPHDYIEATVTTGIVSAFRYHSNSDTKYIQTDADLNPGNSGGPLFSMTGHVVGVNTLTLSFIIADGINFAVSETTVAERLPYLKTWNRPTTHLGLSPNGCITTTTVSPSLSSLMDSGPPTLTCRRLLPIRLRLNSTTGPTDSD